MMVALAQASPLEKTKLREASLDKLTEFVHGHPDTGQDAVQGALGHVLTCMDRYRHGTAIGVAHVVMAAPDPRDGESGALEGSDHLRPR
jgi:hypothetical protein